MAKRAQKAAALSIRDLDAKAAPRNGESGGDATYLNISAPSVWPQSTAQRVADLLQARVATARARQTEKDELQRLQLELTRRQLAATPSPCDSPSPAPQWQQGDVERRLQALEAAYPSFNIHLSAECMAELVDKSPSAVKKSRFWRGTTGKDGVRHGGIIQQREEERRARQRLHDHAELT